MDEEERVDAFSSPVSRTSDDGISVNLGGISQDVQASGERPRTTDNNNPKLQNLTAEKNQIRTHCRLSFVFGFGYFHC